MMQIAHSALYIHLETETPRYSSYITYSSILHVEMSDSTPCTPMHTHTHTHPWYTKHYWLFLKKLNMKGPNDLAIPIPGIYNPKN